MLRASTNSATGSVVQGDYLQIQSTSNTSGTPSQIVMVTQTATATSAGGSAKDYYAVRIEPKLRSDLTAGNYAVFTNPKGTFRLISNEVSWSADRISNYGISFSCIEVI